jgi:hypothetical protein
MIASTNSRVERATDPAINERIREQTENTIAHYEMASPHDVTYRLAELDQEWDVERVLEFNFSGVVLAGIALGTVANRKWYLIPAVAACFMVQHVMQGWCPPLVILRRFGFRTSAEINRERMALKIVRGDFAEVCVPGSGETTASSLLRALEE